MSPRKKQDAGVVDERVLEQIADYCSVMANAKRLAIMWLLGKGERSVGEIAEHIGASIQNTSQHLRVMRDKGAVSHRQEGQSVLYRIANRKFLDASRLVREALSEESRKHAALQRRGDRR